VAPVLTDAVLDGAPLVRIELVEIGRCHRRIALLEAKQDEPCPLFVRNRFAYPGYLLLAATERDLPPSQHARRGDRGPEARPSPWGFPW
jgi:hypothetical protein